MDELIDLAITLGVLLIFAAPRLLGHLYKNAQRKQLEAQQAQEEAQEQQLLAAHEATLFDSLDQFELDDEDDEEAYGTEEASLEREWMQQVPPSSYQAAPTGELRSWEQARVAGTPLVRETPLMPPPRLAARPIEPARPPAGARVPRGLLGQLREGNLETLRFAIVAREILDKPLALRDPDDRLF